MVARNEFRADLYYRMDVVSITIPPLRERKEDILPLINKFLDDFNRKYSKEKIIVPKAMDMMFNYSWPGNVREVANVIEKMVVVAIDNKIGLEDMPEKLWEQHSASTLPITNMKAFIEETEMAMVERAIQVYGSARKAATKLGIDHSTITRKLQRKNNSFK
jgi:transcriptional regulator with PAS, ATPase and Fis domain